jgi:hypothetical protein
VDIFRQNCGNGGKRRIAFQSAPITLTGFLKAEFKDPEIEYAVTELLVPETAE